MIQRYIHNSFDQSLVSTIGLGLETKLYIDKTQTKHKMKIWDTGGQERFFNIT